MTKPQVIPGDGLLEWRKKTGVELIDDLDGSEASQSLTFSLDGVGYEIGLNDQHAEELRSSLAKFAEAARRGRTQAPCQRWKGCQGLLEGHSRAWALSEGLEVNARDRIEASIVDSYLPRASSTRPVTCPSCSVW